MRAVVQRVSRASVRVGGEVVGAVDAGLCVLVGVGRLDDERDAVSVRDPGERLDVENVPGRIADRLAVEHLRGVP